MVDKQQSRGINEDAKALLDGMKVALKAKETVIPKKQAEGLRGMAINLDVSQAITGLKAVQREAKKATQALNEFAKYLNENEGDVQVILSAFSTADLEKQLTLRERSY